MEKCTAGSLQIAKVFGTAIEAAGDVGGTGRVLPIEGFTLYCGRAAPNASPRPMVMLVAEGREYSIPMAIPIPPPIRSDQGAQRRAEELDGGDRRAHGVGDSDSRSASARLGSD
jgi:hypothetical protein